jgi:hypothetical protein
VKKSPKKAKKKGGMQKKWLKSAQNRAKGVVCAIFERFPASQGQKGSKYTILDHFDQYFIFP